MSICKNKKAAVFWGERKKKKKLEKKVHNVVTMR